MDDIDLSLKWGFAAQVFCLGIDAHMKDKATADTLKSEIRKMARQCDAFADALDMLSSARHIVDGFAQCAELVGQKTEQKGAQEMSASMQAFLSKWGKQ